eukprot:4796721-Pyramimonas_sp.AAC.1
MSSTTALLEYGVIHPCWYMRGDGAGPGGGGAGAAAGVRQVRRLALPEEHPPGGGVADHAGEGAVRAHPAPGVPPLSHLRAARQVPLLPPRVLPQGG